MDGVRKSGSEGWRRTAGMACVCLLLGAPAPFVSAAEDEEVPQSEQVKVLRMLAARSKKTWDGLKTWRGACEVEIIGWYFGDKAQRFLDERAPGLKAHPAEFKKIGQGHATFALDLVHDRLFSRLVMYPDDLVDLATDQPFALDPLPSLNRLPPGETVLLRLPYNRTAIVTPEHYLLLEPNVPYTPMSRTVFRKAGEKAKQDWIINPRKFLSYVRPMWEELEIIADAVEQTGWPELGGQALCIWKQGTGAEEEYRVVVPGKTCGERYLLIEMTFRADADFNITKHVTRAMHVLPATTSLNYKEIRWKYRQQEGLFLPFLIERESRTPDATQLTSLRTILLLVSEVNQPISPETFTMQNLGLQEGDRLVDKLAGGGVSVYEGGALRPLDVNLSDIPKPVGGSSE